MKKWIPLLFIILFLISSSSVLAQKEVPVYFFYGEGCPHCAEAKPFLEELQKKYPEITINAYEVWNNKENLELFNSMSAACGIKVVGVPTIFIGHKPIIGFDRPQKKGKEIEAQIIKCIREDCVDLMDLLGTNLSSCPAKEEERTINLPIVGPIDTKKVGLPLFTIIMGLLDGFNPCSMWVLLFLLTLLVYTRSRKKMLLIGGIFILASGIGYFIFMSAWLNLFLFIGFFSFMRILIGSFAVIVGLINMKDLFFFKKGFSLTIPEKIKPLLFKKMRNIVHEAALPAAIVGVITLALTVNFVELLCTAGFPAIYTKILTLNNLHPIQYYLYLLLYIIMYELDDLIVLGIAMWTFGSMKLTKKQGKWMKFIAGIMMFILGLLLIIKPQLLMFG